MAMVSTNNHSQYLCPDFMTPMTSTAEPGKSPLAMLAQTCQSIGLPDPPSKNGKTILPASENGKSPKSGSSSKSLFDDAKADGRNGMSRPTSSQNGLVHGAGASTSQTMPPSVPPALRVPPMPPPGSLNAYVAAGFAGLQHPSTNPAALAYQQALASLSAGFPPGAAAGFPGFPGSHTAAAAHAAMLTAAAAAASRMPCVDPLCKGCPPPLPGVPNRPCPLGCTGCAASMAVGGDLTAAHMMMNPYAPLIAAQYGGVPGLSMSMPSLFFPPPVTASSVPAVSSAPLLNPALGALATAASSTTSSTSTNATTTAATSTTTTSSSSSNPKTVGEPTTPTHACNWANCSQKFETRDQLMTHLMSHLPGASTSSTDDEPSASGKQSSLSDTADSKTEQSTTLRKSASPRAPSKPTMVSPKTPSSSSSVRFHPYSKPNVTSSSSSTSTTSSSSASGIASLAAAAMAAQQAGVSPSVSAASSFGMFSPFAAVAAYNALYGQRLPGSLPHP